MSIYKKKKGGICLCEHPDGYFKVGSLYLVGEIPTQLTIYKGYQTLVLTSGDVVLFIGYLNYGDDFEIEDRFYPLFLTRGVLYTWGTDKHDLHLRFLKMTLQSNDG